MILNALLCFELEIEDYHNIYIGYKTFLKEEP